MAKITIKKVMELEGTNYPYGFSILRDETEQGWYVEQGNWAWNIKEVEICRFDGWLGWHDRNAGGDPDMDERDKREMQQLSRREVAGMLSEVNDGN